MSKEDDRGLLSKVARLVRSPLGWSDLDQGVGDDNRYSKQMLKDMIERRRRNDFVRKREFETLRRFRAQLGEQSSVLRGGHSLNSSQQRLEQQRSKTINKKIDEIEAQMSQQWWKTRHGEGDDRDNPNTDFSPSYPALVPDPRAGQRPGAGGFASPAPAAKGPAAQASREPAVAPAAPLLPGLDFHAVAPSVASAKAAPEPTADSSMHFSYSKLNAMQVDEFTHDPLLEEAAIRFANSDDEGAEAALQEAIRNPDPAVNGNEAVWGTLFDLYRATDKQERFESAALDYANRFDRSAPAWFSIPMKLRQSQAQASDSSFDLDAAWEAPETLSAADVAALERTLERTAQPWCLGWGRLKFIETAALADLLRVFSRWTNESVRLRFTGTSVLANVLRSGTVAGDATADANWWRLRMELLRIMHRPDEFEVAALDYCVTYEVSPPSWDGALCNFKTLDSSITSGYLSSPPTLIRDSQADAISTQPVSDFTDTVRGYVPSVASGNISVVDLSGVIRGEAVEMLDLLNAKMGDSHTILVLCEKLIRVDFMAAGNLLNWVSTRQAEGRQVHFKDLHRLVAVFFHVIGINEHARVIPSTL